MELPDDVRSLGESLAKDPKHELHEMAMQLIADSPELGSMWRSLEKRRVGNDDLWVRGFLETVAEALTLPAFHHKSTKERKRLDEKIKKRGAELARLLEENGLDSHLVYLASDGSNGLDGFFLYEEFSESNRQAIDQEARHKLKLSTLLEGIIDYASGQVLESPIPGNSGANAHAIRFIRVLAERNNCLYETPLNGVLAAVANAIFKTSYSESDVAHLLHR